MIINLTQQDRDKFAAWLEQESKSDDLMAEQALKLPPPTGDAVAKHLKQRSTIFKIVVRELQRIEDMSL